MAVADELMLAVGDRLSQQPTVVTVQEGDFHAVQFDRTKPAVIRLARRFDRQFQLLAVIAIAVDKMRRPRGQQRDNLGGTNVAAMQNSLNAVAFQLSDADAGIVDVAVGIANDAKEHLRLIAAKTIAKTSRAAKCPIA
jgi:hypothetical protein